MNLAPFWSAARRAIASIGLFSGVINLLTLTGSLYMLQVYDRILVSRSIPTLVALLSLVVILFVIQALLEIVRQRLFNRLARVLDQQIAASMFRASVMSQLRPGGRSADNAPMRDLESLRTFITGPGPGALFDLPWVPFYLAVCFIFHPYLGWLTLGGAILVIGIVVIGEFRARALSQPVNITAIQRQSVVEGGQKNAEILATMNLSRRMEQLFIQANVKFGNAFQKTIDSSGAFSAVVRGIRVLLQSAVLSLAAYLAIRQEISGGTIIATSILASRALAPLDAVVSQWRQFVAARQAAGRIRQTLETAAVVEPETSLPAPTQSLTVEKVSLAPPGVEQPLIVDIDFAAKAGEGIGVIGPSGSGKTTLLRGIAGVWPVTSGKITLDNAPLDQYTSETLGASVSYMPQDVHLLSGTIAQNIARFEPDAPDDRIIRAAELANVHDLILKFPQGYDTPIGDMGVKLSAGQRQRIGLARALYGDPFLVILDEPYSNLDAAGDAALTQALLSIKARGGIFILVAHRISALAHVGKVLAIRDGKQTAFGPRDAVLARMSGGNGGGGGSAVPVPAATNTPQTMLKVVRDAEA